MGFRLGLRPGNLCLLLCPCPCLRVSWDKPISSRQVRQRWPFLRFQRGPSLSPEPPPPPFSTTMTSCKIGESKSPLPEHPICGTPCVAAGRSSKAPGTLIAAHRPGGFLVASISPLGIPLAPCQKLGGNKPCQRVSDSKLGFWDFAHGAPYI